ncbi:hypothetical protein [Nonomuraea salmonea]|uniref:hypothetical protein n=1 Tax=Nonomuraea salmonea TaxID=46181 RepID=UPI003CD05825
MLLSGLDGSGRTLLLTLTGPGGGEWRVALGVEDAGPGEPDAHITADVVAFCFLLGGRGDPADFPADLEGDLSLARDVLTTAPPLFPALNPRNRTNSALLTYPVEEKGAERASFTVRAPGKCAAVSQKFWYNDPFAGTLRI